MIRAIVILCLAATSVTGLRPKSLTVRYDEDPTAVGSTSYLSLPMSYSEATAQGWKEMAKCDLPEGYENLALLCPDGNYHLCLFFDDTGYITGLQLGFIRSKFENAVFDWTTSGFVSWWVTEDDETTEYKVTHQLYAAPETLALDSSVRQSSRNDETLLQEQLYVKGFYGELVNISTNIADLDASSDFVKLACIPGMGYHYYHLMSEPDCRADTILTWFGLVHSEQLIGVGFMIPGNYTVEDDKVNYFEHPGIDIIKLLSPAGPQCLWDYGNTTGLTTMHTFFVQDGDSMTC